MKASELIQKLKRAIKESGDGLITINMGCIPSPNWTMNIELDEYCTPNPSRRPGVAHGFQVNEN
jgi:hypothetical protein